MWFFRNPLKCLVCNSGEPDDCGEYFIFFMDDCGEYSFFFRDDYGEYYIFFYCGEKLPQGHHKMIVVNILSFFRDDCGEYSIFFRATVVNILSFLIVVKIFFCRDTTR